MWPPWLTSPSRAEPTTPSPRHRRTFSTFSTFKDVETLLHQPQHHNNHLLLPSLFNRVRLSTSLLRALSPDPSPPPQPVVFYFTSLRVVRRTFDDCRTVRSILRGLRVPIDERDVSMDSGFLDELKEVLGVKRSVSVSLPRVFVGGRCVGGVEEVRRLNECGELKKLIGVGRGGQGGGGARCCEVCDGHRFVVCGKCDGSRKVYYEKSGFRSCGECNVNGLVRCPGCFCSKRLL